MVVYVESCSLKYNKVVYIDSFLSFLWSFFDCGVITRLFDLPEFSSFECCG